VKAKENAEALVVVTEWKSFWSPDFGLLKEKGVACYVIGQSKVG